MSSETLEAICDRFESDWQAGRAPQIEPLLADVGAGERQALLRELMQIELWWRRDETPPPQESEYRSRFPGAIAIVADGFEQFEQRQLSVETMAVPGEMTVSEQPDDFQTQVEDGSERDRVRLAPGAPKRQFGRYRVLRELGRGGMGAVYLAHDEKLNRRIALKIPTFHGSERDEMISRFLREARTAGALRGSGICPIFDVGEIDGQFFIAMAYIEGRPLRDDTRRGKPHDVEQTVRLIRVIASAMSEAHEAGIIHRDLKPANIMIRDGGEPVIMDFGLARSTSETESHLTGTGAILGTPTYMSPEQAMGDKPRIGPTTDIYSLGVIFYEMLAGRPPFRGNVTAVLTQIATSDPKPLDEYAPGIPSTVAAIVRRMMAKQVEQRFPSMAEVVSSLTAYLDEVAAPSQTGRAVTASTSRSLQPVSGAVTPAGSGDASLDQFLHARKGSEAARPQPPAGSPSDRSPERTGLSRTSRRLRTADLTTVGAGIATLIMLLGGLYFTLRGGGDSDPATTQTVSHSDDGQSRQTTPADRTENSIGMRFVPIKPGTFTMGEGETAHQVTLTKPFELGQFEVTQEQYERVMGNNPGQFKAAQNPVNSVSWKDAVEFCRKLSELPEEQASGFVYRLPTEAEWEYACRAGTTTTFSFGDDEILLDDYAWHSDTFLHPVGQKKPNPWGLYDMHGNVWEWCQDWYGSYPSGSVTDPAGPESGSNRVFRGASVGSRVDVHRSAYREKYGPDHRTSGLGFRVVRVPVAVVENSIGMRFVPIRPGTFTMGEGDTAHQVTLTKTFELGQFEVTQEQYERVVGNNFASQGGGPSYPVNNLSWNDAVEFCQRLSDLPAERAAGFVYRLPTEAEWEYACRAGTVSMYSFGDNVARLDEYAWFEDNSDSKVHPVGQKKSNPWGLYDMHGNVWEWCQDWHGSPSGDSETDPTGPKWGSIRINRGGSWRYNSEGCRSACRDTYSHGDRTDSVGCRVVRVPAGSVENSIGMRFVPIRPGTFTMGEGDTAHQVTLTKPFELAQFEVTQEQYERVMGNNPSHFKGPQNPVEMVSWDDAVEYCRKLSALPAEKAAGYVYRLPTEAEWEYACRAGTTTRFSFGEDDAQLGEYAWYTSNAERSTHPVGQKSPNPWDLYDMHGNVWEWCHDWYHAFSSSSVTDSGGPSSGSDRVDRGGGWYSELKDCRSGHRGRNAPGRSSNSLGFRLVRDGLP